MLPPSQTRELQTEAKVNVILLSDQGITYRGYSQCYPPLRPGNYIQRLKLMLSSSQTRELQTEATVNVTPCPTIELQTEATVNETPLLRPRNYRQRLQAMLALSSDQGITERCCSQWDPSRQGHFWQTKGYMEEQMQFWMWNYHFHLHILLFPRLTCLCQNPFLVQTHIRNPWYNYDASWGWKLIDV